MSEFKKRLSKPRLEEYVAVCPHDTWGECDCGMQWIYNIIDEARKEYPSLTSLGLVPCLSDEDVNKIAQARNKWFLKWFGDKK